MNEELKIAKQKYANVYENERKELLSSISWCFINENFKKKNIIKIRDKMRFIDVICIILAIIGIFSNFLSSYYYLDFFKIYEKPNIISLHLKTNPTTIVQILRSITSLTTISLIILIVKQYKSKLNLLKLKNKIQVNSTIISSKLIYPLILEILINLIHSFPMMDYFIIKFPQDLDNTNNNHVDIDLDLITSSLITIRLYLIIKYLISNSQFGDERAEKICNQCNTRGGINFTIKANLKERPYSILIFILFSSIFIFGFALRNVEVAFLQKTKIKNFQDWTYIWNGYWCIAITIFSVGYGDFYPQTFLGRGIAVISAIWGAIFISLAIVNMTDSVNFTQQEKKAYDSIKKLLNENLLKINAIKFIRNACKLKNLIEIYEEYKESKGFNKYLADTAFLKNKINLFINKFKSSFDEFKNCRKSFLNFRQNNSFDTILNKINQCVSYDLEELINLSNLNMKNLVSYVKYSKELNEEVKLHTESLKRLTKGLHDCLKIKI